MHTEKPKLPSIKHLLEDVTIPKEQRLHRHRRHASDQTSVFPAMSLNFPDKKHPFRMPLVPASVQAAIEIPMANLPSHMQTLSLSNNQPAPVEPRLREAAHPSKFPYYSIHTNCMPSSMLFHRSPKNMHTRSYSDYTHSYTPRGPTTTTNTTTTTTTPTTPTTPATSHLPPLHPVYHRRAASTNTFDLLPVHSELPSLCPSSSASTATSNAPLSPSLSHTTPHSPTIDEYMSCYSDFSAGSEQHSPLPPSSQPTQQQQDTEDSQWTANKYHCPYCNKGFSRPSSLRIHTYSHTGEKPFDCPEEGCDRKFSVQSNMRRHLRVHRLGRTFKRSPNERPAIHKAIAAKPSWIGTKPSSQSL